MIGYHSNLLGTTDLGESLKNILREITIGLYGGLIPLGFSNINSNQSWPGSAFEALNNFDNVRQPSSPPRKLMSRFYYVVLLLSVVLEVRLMFIFPISFLGSSYYKVNSLAKRVLDDIFRDSLAVDNPRKTFFIRDNVLQSNFHTTNILQLNLVTFIAIL